MPNLGAIGSNTIFREISLVTILKLRFRRPLKPIKLYFKLLSTKTLSSSSIQHCTSQLQTNYCFYNETSYRAMLHAKSCNVKHNSESVFRYFASAVNTNESLKCNRKDLSTICSYRSLQKVGYVPLHTVRKSLFGIPATGL